MIHAKCTETIRRLFECSEKDQDEIFRLREQVDLLTSEMVQLWGYNPDDHELELVSECLRNKLRKWLGNKKTCCNRTCCNHKLIDKKDCDCKPEEMKFYSNKGEE
jgi:hypothetical protein